MVQIARLSQCHTVKVTVHSGIAAKVSTAPSVISSADYLASYLIHPFLANVFSYPCY